MATQTSLRISSDRGGILGTLKRDVRPSDAFFIEPQLNVFGVLMGGAHINAKGQEVSSPKLIKTVEAKSYIVENFTQENNTRTFKVTADAAAAATTVYVSVADAAKIIQYTLFQVGENGVQVYANSVNTSTGAITVPAISGAITTGMSLNSMGQVQGENISSAPYLLRDEDNHYTYTSILNKRWERSIREGEMDRFTGKTYGNDQKTMRREIMYDMEALYFGAKRTSSIGTNSATVGMGLEEYSSSNGSLYDFGGTVEKGEFRQFGIRCGDYNSKKLILCSSIETISAIQSVMDDSIRGKASEVVEGIPMATDMQVGPARITMIPTNFYSQPGKEGTGIVFDTEKVDIHNLSPLRLYTVNEGEDHTQKTSKAGTWYSDSCIRALDGGKGIVKFEGANNFAS